MARRITSPQDLKALRDQARAQVDVRGEPHDVTLTVHMGTCGIAAGARDVLAQLTRELTAAAVTSAVLRQSGCLGLCDQEPMLTLTDKEGRSFVYGKLNQRKVSDIVREHVIAGQAVQEHLVRTQRGEREYGQLSLIHI